MVVSVLDSDLLALLRFKLQNSDLHSAKPRTIRRQLEKDLGADLSDRKAFIREQIRIFKDGKKHDEGTKRDNDVVMGDAEKGSTKLNEEEDEVKKNRDAYNKFLGVADDDDGGDDGEQNETKDEKSEMDVQKESNVQRNEGVSTKVDGKVRKRVGRYDELCSLSPQLQDFTGVSELSRREVLKKLWAYIKEKNLQDPEKRNSIFCDERLRTLFNVDKFYSSQMTTLMSKHMLPLNGAEGFHVPNLVDDNAVQEVEGDEDKKRDKKSEKDVKKASSALRKKGGSAKVDGEVKKLYSLSPQLQDIIGVVSELSRTEVYNKLWAYFREHKLQDPKDGRIIFCDERLRALSDVDSFTIFQMNKIFFKHILPLKGAKGTRKPKVKPQDGGGSKKVGDNAVPEADQDDKGRENDKKRKKDVNKESKVQKKKGRSAKVDGEVTEKRGRFNQLRSLSPLLQELMGGESEMGRQDVGKKLWTYIWENNLQDPKDRKIILCDERLRALFDVDSVDMFQMQKLLTKHLLPLNGEQGTEKPKVKPEDGGGSKKVGDNAVPEADQDDKKRKKDVNKETKVQKKKGRSAKVDGEVTKQRSRFNQLRSLTPQLQELMGGESEMGRTDVVKKLWVYIGEHNLKDPKNRKTVLCDERLRDLFDVDSVDIFQMQKLLSKHLLPLNGEQAKDKSVQEARGVKQVRADGSDELEPERKRQKECESS